MIFCRKYNPPQVSEFCGPAYISLSAAEKHEMIWAKVENDPTPADWLSNSEVLEFVIANMKLSLNSPGNDIRFRR